MRSRYISLNSQYYFDDEDTVALREQQDAWAHQAFREATLYQAKHVVVLSHVPPFVADEDEQAGWANWKWHHRRALLDAATAAGAKLWLSGHYHGNSVATSRGGIEVVVTSSCGGVINWTLDASLIATQPFPDFSKVHAACIIPTRARERADLPLCRLTPRDLLRRSRRRWWVHLRSSRTHGTRVCGLCASRSAASRTDGSSSPTCRALWTTPSPAVLAGRR